MIVVSYNISLSPTTLADADALVKSMQCRKIYENTLAIPFPYTKEDADTWLEDNQIFNEENGIIKNFAIRNETGSMIGVIGIQFNYGLQSNKSEFGYWLDKAYWNQGIVTEVIKKFCEVAKTQYRLNILEAHVFALNLASKRVLLKAGFTEVEKIKNKYSKDGKKIDAVKFVKEL